MTDAKATKPNTPETGKSKKRRGKKAVFLPMLVLVLGLATGGYFMLSGSKNSSAESSTTTTTGLGPIVRLAPVTLNLIDGHALKVGLALQMVSEPHNPELATLLGASSGGGSGAHGGGSSSEQPASATGSIPASPLSGQESKALNIAILKLGDMTYDDLSRKGGRAEAADMLTQEIGAAYEGDVLRVYFTEFTMK